MSVSGQKALATVTRLEPEIHQRCYFEYSVGAHSYEGLESGCDAVAGQSVTVIYLPSEPSFASLKSPQKELGLQVFATVFLSLLAGVMGVLRAR